MKYLNLIDIFTNDFKLNIKGKTTYNSFIGIIFSICMFILTVILTWYFGQDIYLRKSPALYSKVAFNNDTPFFTVNTSSFFFALKIEDEIGNTFDDPRFFRIGYQISL